MTDKGIIVEYICPCGWRMSETEYMAVKYDYGCPRCKRSFVIFKQVKEKSNEKGDANA